MNKTSDSLGTTKTLAGPSLVLVEADTVNGELQDAGQRPGADSGNPMLGLLKLDSQGNGNVGVWECAPGGWPVDNRQDTEVCYILSGTAVLTDQSTGDKHRISAGDFLVLPVGWSGRWDVEQTVRKVYAIY